MKRRLASIFGRRILLADADHERRAMLRGRLHSIQNGKKADSTTLLRATRIYDGKTVPSADVAEELGAFELVLKQTAGRPGHL